MSDIVAELTWRGLIHQTTDDANLQKWLAESSRTLYVGFDPTAESLHVGAEDFMAKPFSRTRLLASISRLLGPAVKLAAD